MLGSRIKEERERLGLTQDAFAAIAGAKRRTLVDWEKGGTSPTAVQLSALGEAGVDVLYVVTGIRHTPPVVTPVNPELLRRIIEAVEGELSRRHLKLDAVKKAEAISLLYQMFETKGEIEAPQVERFLRLVA